MSDRLDAFTSTGLKFWLHPEHIAAYRDGTGKSVISTHVSPTAKCNLKCPYCSVENRDPTAELELAVINDYISRLIDRGLKFVVLTGGGDPLMYRQFDYLVNSLHGADLQLGLITNGTRCRKHNLSRFEWVRISYNAGATIDFRPSMVKDGCTIGLSVIVHPEFDINLIDEVRQIADEINAEYIRLTRDCRPKARNDHDHTFSLLYQWELRDKRFMVQEKTARRCNATVCHQAYFRPYLCEQDGGWVYPCDSVVLNDKERRFQEKYRICRPCDVGKFLDAHIRMSFNPSTDCPGCVFAASVEKLGLVRKPMAHVHSV